MGTRLESNYLTNVVDFEKDNRRLNVSSSKKIDWIEPQMVSMH